MPNICVILIYAAYAIARACWWYGLTNLCFEYVVEKRKRRLCQISPHRISLLSRPTALTNERQPMPSGTFHAEITYHSSPQCRGQDLRGPHAALCREYRCFLGRDFQNTCERPRSLPAPSLSLSSVLGGVPCSVAGPLATCRPGI